ncbi:MAG TPA: helix-turn-helix domain-containing protein [Herpetosiphonaceae bacterium]
MAESPSHEQDWLTLSEASKLLGVHPATLRQWSDEGKVRIFRTPGGHRRFSHADIERMLQVTPLRGAGLSSYLMTEALERTRQELPGALGQNWARGIGEDERQRQRQSGRQLVALTTQLIGKRTPTTEQREIAQRLGREYGEMMARTGHSLPDAVMAFIFFRDSLLETVFSLPETTGLDRDETLAIVRRINDLLNEVLRAMMDAHAQTAAAPGAEG